MSDDTAERNKALVMRAINDLFYTNPPRLETLDEVVHENYIQHNPAAGQGREGVRDFVTKVLPSGGEVTDQFNKSELVEVNLIAEGDMVMRQEIRKDWMLVDIFRVRDGMLVEHWDAIRMAPGMKPIPGF